MPTSKVKLLDGALAVFYSLFAFSSTFSIAVSQSSFAVALLLFLLILLVRRYNPFTSRLRIFYSFIGLYVFWMLLAAVLGKTPWQSISMIKEEWLFLIIPVGIYLCENDRYRGWVVRSLAVGVVLMSFYGILQHFFGFHWPKSSPPAAAFDYGYIAIGTFSNALTFGNYYGTAAAFMAAFAILGWREMNRTDKWLSGWAGVLAVMVTVFSHSRGSILGLIVALVVLGLLLKKRWFFISLLVALVGGLIVITAVTSVREKMVSVMARDMNTTDPAGRPFIWLHSLKIVEAHPFLGVGEGNFYWEYADRLPPGTPDRRKYTHAHDDFLNVAAMSGIPGMVFFLGQWFALFALCWAGWRRRNLFPGRSRYFAAGLVGALMFFVSSITEATFADEEVRQLLMLVWAMGIWQWHTVGNSKKSEPKAAHEV